MGSAPSKSSLRKNGLLFVDESDSAPESEDEQGVDQVTNIHYSDVTTTSFMINWKAPKGVSVEKYQLRIFPPDSLRCKTWVSDWRQTSYMFDRLKEGKSYTVGITVVDIEGNKSMCATKTETTRPVPPTMMIFPPKATTATAVVVCWKQSKGSRDYYEAHIKPTEGVTGSTKATKIYDTEHTFTGLVSGVEYEVVVVSVSNKMTSPELKGKVITKPATVLDVTFTEVTCNQISISWKPPSGVVESYTLTLEDSTDDTGPVTISKITDCSYTFNGLRAGRNYLLKITSHALGKESNPKEFDQCTVPNEVTNLICRNITRDSATVTWNKAAGDAENYDLFLSPREGVVGDTCPIGITGTTYVFQGLVNGTMYTIGVVTNAKDKTSKRVVSSFLTEPSSCGEITFPLNNHKTNSLEVKWEKAHGNIDTYTIEVKNLQDVSNKWKIENIKGCSHIVGDLQSGCRYYFNITCFSSGRESTSVGAECSTYPKPPAAIEIAVEKSTSRSITFNWRPPDGYVESFKIRSTSPGYLYETTVARDCQEYELLELNPGSDYETSVICHSNKLDSEEITSMFTTGPDKASNLSLDVLSKNEIKVKWDAPNALIDNYNLTCVPGEVVDCDTEPKGIQITEHVFTCLIPGTKYDISVTPVSRDVVGAAIEDSAETIPGDILNVHFPGDNIFHDSFKVVWGIEGNATNVNLTLTKVEKDANGSTISEKTSQYTLMGVTEYTFQDLDDNTTYTITLNAISDNGVKGAVNTFTHHTPSKPEEPKPEIKPSEQDIENSDDQEVPFKEPKPKEEEINEEKDSISLSSSSSLSDDDDEEFLE